MITNSYSVLSLYIELLSRGTYITKINEHILSNNRKCYTVSTKLNTLFYLH